MPKQVFILPVETDTLIRVLGELIYEAEENLTI